jgi:hypothetical protein
MKIKRIKLLVLIIVIFSLIGFTQNLYADENNAVSIVEKERKATNSRNFEALEKLYSEDFEIEIILCDI